MLAHFEDYNDIVGDHPLNLLTTSLALNAFMATGEEKYKRWLLEYVEAWYGRIVANGNIIPSNVGLDGTIGGATDGKWYGGAYGWGFTVIVPQNGQLAHRNRTAWGFTGFSNAYLLTGDDRYLDIWRKQREAIHAQAKMVDGRLLYPRMHGDDGWYFYGPEKYTLNDLAIYYLSMDPKDRQHLPTEGWLAYLEGQDPDYPARALQADLANVRARVAGMRGDTTTPDTRLSDDPMSYNPASVNSLRELMVGGLAFKKSSSVLHARLRYFDPRARRAGVPPDVAALIETMDAGSVTFWLVNTDPVDDREVVVQAGAYGEHLFVSVTCEGRKHAVDAPWFPVRLAPGSGARLVATIKRYANVPTMAFPWDRGWRD